MTLSLTVDLCDGHQCPLPVLEVDKGVVSDLLDPLHRSNGGEGLLKLGLCRAEHQVSNVNHLHLHGQRRGS